MTPTKSPELLLLIEDNLIAVKLLATWQGVKKKSKAKLSEDCLAEWASLSGMSVRQIREDAVMLQKNGFISQQGVDRTALTIIQKQASKVIHAAM